MTHSIHVGPPATSRIRSAVLDWDIGRVNTKAVRVEVEDGRPRHPGTVSASRFLDPAEARERPIEVASLLADAIATT
jgi:hypothetical protein